MWLLFVSCRLFLFFFLSGLTWKDDLLPALKGQFMDKFLRKLAQELKTLTGERRFAAGAAADKGSKTDAATVVEPTLDVGAETAGAEAAGAGDDDGDGVGEAGRDSDDDEEDTRTRGKMHGDESESSDDEEDSDEVSVAKPKSATSSSAKNGHQSLVDSDEEEEEGTASNAVDDGDGAGKVGSHKVDANVNMGKYPYFRSLHVCLRGDAEEDEDDDEDAQGESDACAWAEIRLQLDPDLPKLMFPLVVEAAAEATIVRQVRGISNGAVLELRDHNEADFAVQVRACFFLCNSIRRFVMA